MSNPLTKSDIGLLLEPGLLDVIRLRITLERHGRDNCELIENRLCHYYMVMGAEYNDVDLYRVVDGRLTRLETLRGFSAIAEVED